MMKSRTESSGLNITGSSELINLLQGYTFKGRVKAAGIKLLQRSVPFMIAAVVLLLSTHESSGELRRCRIKLYDLTGREIRLNVEIAANDREREKGLMYRTSMPQDSGMLFVFEKDKRLSFWMKNTYIPLDIAFIDSHGIIKDIYQMRPLDTSVFYNSSSEVRYALEVNQWWFAKNGIRVGAKTGLNGCISK